MILWPKLVIIDQGVLYLAKVKTKYYEAYSEKHFRILECISRLCFSLLKIYLNEILIQNSHMH